VLRHEPVHWSPDARGGSVSPMEIGPVRRRFTAEPASSPVPGEAVPAHEPAADERAPRAASPVRSGRDAVEAGRPDRAS